MGKLRDQMTMEMELRNYSPKTLPNTIDFSLKFFGIFI